jgi:hypothetical protein
VEPSRPITVVPSPLQGRGVFTTRSVSAGEVLEVAPVLVVPAGQRSYLDRTALAGHYWDWDGDAALAMGLISFTNHARPGNARWERDDEARTLTLIAVCDLPPGTEVVVDYLDGGDEDLWFEPQV